MNIVQVGILGIVGVLMAIQVKQEKAGIALCLSIGISILIFVGIFDGVKIVVQTIKTINEFLQIEHLYLNTLLKMLGITYVAEFSSGLCKDAGYQAIAVQIELFGKITILVLSLPILLALLNTIREFLK